RHTRCLSDLSSDVCSSDLVTVANRKAVGQPTNLTISLAKRRAVSVSSDTLTDDGRPESVMTDSLKALASAAIVVSFSPSKMNSRSEERRVGKRGDCGCLRV